MQDADSRSDANGSPPCGVCGDPLDRHGLVACAHCGAPAHRDCWEYTGGCGVFGCGGLESLEGDDARVARGARGAGALVIREDDPDLPTTRPGRGTRLRRRVRAALAQSGPAAGLGLGTGLVLFVFFGLQLFDAAASPAAIVALPLAGLLHGLIAPHLSRSLLDHPGRWALASGAAVLLLFTQVTWMGLLEMTMAVQVALCVASLVAGVLFSTSLADLVRVGRARRDAGGRLAARPAYGVAWAAFVGIFALGIHLDPTAWLTGAALRDVLIFSTMGMVGARAVERGKAEAREALSAGSADTTRCRAGPPRP